MNASIRPGPAPVAVHASWSRVAAALLAAAAIAGCGGGGGDGGGAASPAAGAQSATADALAAAPSVSGTGALQGLGGKCLDIPNNEHVDGRGVQLYECNNTNAQKWTYGADRTLRSTEGKCLDLNGWSQNDGARVIIWSCHGGANQQWTFEGTTLRSAFNGKCVDVTNGQTRNGTPIQVWGCGAGNPNQQWNWVPVATGGPVAVQVSERLTGLANPWGMAWLPDGRLLVTERAGNLRLASANGASVGTVSGVPAVLYEGQGGLLDVAVDPAFATNRRIYLSYSERDASNSALSGTAVARAELSADGLSLGNVAVIYRQQPKVASTAHFGSRLVFDREGRLFVTLGDRSTPQQRGFAQDLSRGNGKVARITTDGAPAPGNPAWQDANAQPAFWSYGHRNPQGAALHPTTGELWTSEHGPQGGDEINRTVAGGNFGWPLASYGQEYGTTTPVGVETLAGTLQPAWVWNTRTGDAWTGGAKSSTAPAGMSFYTGNAVPQWRGSLFVTALAGQSLWRLTLDGSTVTGQERLLASLGQRMRDVEQGPDGALYILTDSGRLLRYGP